MTIIKYKNNSPQFIPYNRYNLENNFLFIYLWKSYIWCFILLRTNLFIISVSEGGEGEGDINVIQPAPSRKNRAESTGT